MLEDEGAETKLGPFLTGAGSIVSHCVSQSCITVQGIWKDIEKWIDANISS